MPSWPGYYYDGRTAQRQKATISLSGEALIIESAAREPVVWPYEEVRLVQGRHGNEPIRLEKPLPSTEAVVVADRLFLEALESLPGEVSLTLFARRAGRRQVATAFVLALLAVLLFGIGSFWGLPAAVEIIAREVPPAWEEKLGNSVEERWFSHLEQVDDPELLEAIDGMVARLNRAAMPHPYEFRLRVVKQEDVVNAFAMPGGYIVVFSGLLEATESPEEMAGVLAHEMEHVLQKHATKSLIKNTSTSLLLKLLFGNDDLSGLAGSSLNVLEQFRYSRQNEEEADRAGARLMAKAGIDPHGMTEFFKHLEKDGQAAFMPTYLSTHPATAERIEMLEEDLSGLDGSKAYSPLMPDGRWQAMIASQSKGDYNALAISTLREAISQLETYYLEHSRYPDKLSDCGLVASPKITLTYSKSADEEYVLTSCHEHGSVLYTWETSEMIIKESKR